MGHFLEFVELLKKYTLEIMQTSLDSLPLESSHVPSSGIHRAASNGAFFFLVLFFPPNNAVK